jgi:hypothetical protein
LLLLLLLLLLVGLFMKAHLLLDDSLPPHVSPHIRGLRSDLLSS